MASETHPPEAQRPVELAEPESLQTIDRLVPLVYEELRRLARRQLARERGDLTLQTTALVHEAYLKLAKDRRVTAHGRAYFFAAAARAMRQVLVDRARKRLAVRRGGGMKREPLDEAEIRVDAFAAELIDLDRALERLATRSRRQVMIVEHRFFASMTVQETATALGVSTRTVELEWAMARAWLFKELGGSLLSGSLGGAS